MCVVEITTYVDGNGHYRVTERDIPCANAVGEHLCSDITRRTFRSSIVEGRPSSRARDTSRDSHIVITENVRGRKKVYRDLSKKSSSSSSIHRRSGTSFGSPVSQPSSASTPPPRSASGNFSRSIPKPESPLLERERMPYPPPDPLEQDWTIMGNGNAVYENPPPLDLNRAMNNERSQQPRRPSAVGFEASGALPPKPSHRSSTAYVTDVVEDDTFVAAGSGRPRETGHVRQDSGRVLRPILRNPTRRANEEERVEAERRQLEEERHRRRQREDERQARLVYDRIQEGERRQRAREESRERRRARDASRERRDRHRAEAAAILEGNRQRQTDNIIQANRESELEHAARERAEASGRLSRDMANYQQRISRDSDSFSRRDYTELRRYTNESSTRPPLPPVPPIAPRPPVLIHQYRTPLASRPSRPSSSFRELGDSVIAREQARAAHASLTQSLGGLALEEAVADEDSLFDENDIVVDVIEDRSGRRVRTERVRRWR